MKWSDGKPFTADDFVFWFEDIYRNKDLVPTPSAALAINGKQGTVEKVDATTVKFKFPEPYFMFPDMLAGSTDVGGQAWRGTLGLGGYAPAHYLKQFHPKYVGQAELDKKTKDAEVRQLGADVLQQERLVAQPRPARALAVEDGDARSTRRPGRSSATPTASTWTPRATSCPTSTGWC